MRFLGGLISWRYVLWFLAFTLVSCNSTPPPPAQGAPQVASAVVGDEYVHGNEMFISGNYFGSAPTVLIWDDFESGSAEQNIGGHASVIGGTWSHWGTTGYNYAKYSTMEVYAGSRSARFTYHEVAPTYGKGCSIHQNFSGQDQIYVSFYGYSDPWNCSRTGPGWRLNNKKWFWSWMASPTSGDAIMNAHTSIWQCYLSSQILSGCSKYFPTPGWGSDTSWSTQCHAWHRHEMWWKPNTSPSTNNGQVKCWWDADLRHSATNYNWASTCYSYPNDVRTTGFRIGAMIRYDNGTNSVTINPPGSVYTHWDDFYVASSQARVEIGNAATWSSCTHREIQAVFSSWSISEIQVTLNQGTFSAGEQFWVYVVDSNGAYNSTGHGPILWEQGAAVPCAGYPH